MGHVSRIWNIRFYSTPSPPPRRGAGHEGNVPATVLVENLKVYSFGEDATAQRWRLALEVISRAAANTDGLVGSGEQQQQQLPIANGLVHEAVIHRHNGKHIWSSALLYQPQCEDGKGSTSSSSSYTGPKTLVATGGNDGKVSIVEDVDSGDDQQQQDTRSISLEISGSEVARQAGFAADSNMNEDALEQAIMTPAPKNPKRGALKDEDEPFMMYALLSSTTTTAPTFSTPPSATSPCPSFTSSSTILATTPAGRIFSGVLQDPARAEVRWDEVRLPSAIQADLRRYQVIRTLGGNNKVSLNSSSAAIIGSASGNLYTYRLGGDGDDRQSGTFKHIRKMDRKIADIFPLPNSDFAGLVISPLEEGGEEENLFTPVVVLTMGSSSVQLLLLNSLSAGNSDDNNNGAAETIQAEYTIDLEKGFTPTAVGCCDGHLIFGSRTGALLIYKPVVAQQSSNTTFGLIARVDRPFTKDAVSAIVPLPAAAAAAAANISLSSSAPYFLTTSRDGRFRIYELLNITTPATVHLRHEAVPPLGPNIESAFFTTTSSPSSSPELILAGFRSRNFIVWNETRQLELANVECGGAYRSFTYRIDPLNPEQLSFVWTKASRTCVYGQRALSRRVVKGGGHGREIKAVAACSSNSGSGDDDGYAGSSLLATGAEDTTLRIWSYNKLPSTSTQSTTELLAEGNNMHRNLKCLAVVERHTTGIQCLKWAGDKYLVSSSGNEELFIWRITRLAGSTYEGLAVFCEGVYPDKTKDGDLRVLSFDVQVLPHSGNKEEVLVLSLVLSNSTLKTYRYSRTNGFKLLAEGRYTGACLMQIRHLRVVGDAAQMHVLTASTDGHIALWKTSAASDPESTAIYSLEEVLRLHQSGIKALDMVPLPLASRCQDGTVGEGAASYALVTGGDDSAIGHVQLDWSATGQRYVVVSRCLANGAHAAAVMGLCISDASLDTMAEGGHQLRLQTASNDQRVKMWLIRVDTGGRVSKVSLIEDRYSAIADCGDLGVVETDSGRDVVVVGVGMEFWSV
ncbi:WD40-repeat-containing domain protein [Coniella lustricola]|uniref:WD40-repeat-containing domain protein n=1 Tax=Coniella lustricola TaxID=2025994 RepID=A0A2T3A9Y8_9PEZI|nr:WD40-repeat-containing domain protein [Coniella lustricola]